MDQEPKNQAFIRALFKIRAALTAWIRKYFTAASTFRGVKLAHNTGIRASVLSSRPVHIINQFSLEITIKVPSTILRARKMKVGRCIELEGTLTLNYLIIS